MIAFGMINALAIGSVQQHTTPEKSFATGYKKIHTNHQVWLNLHGLQGDFQADTKHHGGTDKAVLAFGESSYRILAEQGFSHLKPGALGENITLGYWDETNVCIGDRFQIGETEVEVSQPRQPCWKINAVLGETNLLRSVFQTGRTGWYLRVFREGYWQKGMQVTLLKRPHPEWTIARANEIMADKKNHGGDAKALLELPELADAWKKDLARGL